MDGEGGGPAVEMEATRLGLEGPVRPKNREEAERPKDGRSRQSSSSSGSIKSSSPPPLQTQTPHRTMKRERAFALQALSEIPNFPGRTRSGRPIAPLPDPRPPCSSSAASRPGLGLGPAMDPPHLMDELVEEILLRLPPDDPASLFRGGGFRRRFRELHRAPPVLGFFYHGAYFASSSSFRPAHGVRLGWGVHDARHGRVLIENTMSSIFKEPQFAVWDPITDDVRSLPALRLPGGSEWSAALVCTAAGCDHLDCPSDGAFLVVAAATDMFYGMSTSAHVYSSEQDAWSEPVSSAYDHHYQPGRVLSPQRVLVDNTLYFNYARHTGILEYDLGKRQLSIIDAPPSASHEWQLHVLMETEDGGLGSATLQGSSSLCVWSREAGGEGGCAGWVQRRVIHLDKLPPVPDCNLSISELVLAHPRSSYVVAAADSVIFVWICGLLFTVHLKSGQVKKVGSRNSNDDDNVVPYMRFYTPGTRLVPLEHLQQ